MVGGYTKLMHIARLPTLSYNVSNGDCMIHYKIGYGPFHLCM
jgi:hypothetical protein